MKTSRIPQENLQDQYQRVVVDDAASNWVCVTSGVHQGSILDPILFSIFKNDLPEVVPCFVSTALYADDTKLFRNISSVGDCKELQETLTVRGLCSRQNITFASLQINARFSLSPANLN